MSCLLHQFPVLIALIALAACAAPTPQVGRSSFAPLNCPNLTSLSQQYMKGRSGIPVRCTGQTRSAINSNL